MDSRSINREVTGGNAPCNVPNPAVDPVQSNGNEPGKMTKVAQSPAARIAIVILAGEEVYWETQLV